MGSDLSVVNAARVSFSKESEMIWVEDSPTMYKETLSDKDKKLVGYLAKHNHWSPFGHASMQFHIKAVETLKRRTDGNTECYDWKYFDSETIEDVMKSVGCQPPYWKSIYNNHSSCNSSAQMRSIATHYQAKLYQDDQFQNVIPPCVEIKKVDVEFDEDIGDKSNKVIVLVHGATFGSLAYEELSLIHI